VSQTEAYRDSLPFEGKGKGMEGKAREGHLSAPPLKGKGKEREGHLSAPPLKLHAWRAGA